MKLKIYYQSPYLQQLVEESDVQFLLSRMYKHAPHLYHHSLRVAGLFDMLWSNVELDLETRNKVLRSVLLHDIGCLHIPKDELHEPHPEHTKIGVDILSVLIKEGRVDKEMVLYHHENMDGTGFPYGVNWRKLSPFVRTLRIVDDFDLWSGGLYTELAVTVAMDELYLWSGVLLDEHWLDRFNHMLGDAIKTRPLQLDAISRM